MEKTVLVLGAGVSAPYKYPIGSTLVRNIIKTWKGADNVPDARRYISLAKALDDVAAKSIDRFLSAKENFLEIGIECIVDQILAAEARSVGSEPDPEEDFYSLLVDLDETLYEQLTIVSFNYDRLLERKFLKRLEALSGSRSDAVERLRRLKIIHIHGRMPPLFKEECPSLGLASDQAIPYALEDIEGFEKNARDFAVHFALKHFKTVYTNDEKPNVAAVNAIKRANRIFFLGFGFDEKNMLKLGIGADGVHYDWGSKQVAGTCYRMDKTDLNKTRNKYPFFKKNLFEVNARQFFADCVCIDDSDADEVELAFNKRTCCEIAAIQTQPVAREDAIGVSRQRICDACGILSQVRYTRSPGGKVWRIEKLTQVASPGSFDSKNIANLED